MFAAASDEAKGIGLGKEIRRLVHMAMTIVNNPSAMLTLGELNKNNNKLGKQLKKVSSGMRINGAGDDASGYAIGKRMEVMKRALGQAIQNSQTGRNLVRVAEGGIQEIINNMRSMKELALNSANDTNTDLDRATIEKEFASRMVTIRDIATETNYNGKLLLNGDYPVMDSHINVSYRVETQTVTTTYLDRRYIRTPMGVSPVPTVRYYSEKVLNDVEGFVDRFSPASSNCVDMGEGEAWDGARCDKVFVGSPSDWKSDGRNPSKIAVDIDLSGMKKTDRSPLSIPEDLHEQGFTILCGYCSQFINIKFDKTLGVLDSTYTSYANNSREHCEYVIGIGGVYTAEELEEALFEGIKNAAGKSTTAEGIYGGHYAAEDDSDDSVMIDEYHNVRIAKKEDGSGYVFLKNNDGCSMCFYDEGTYVQRAVEEYPIIYNTEVVETPRTVTETRRVVVEDEELVQTGKPLIIHTGPRANQELHVFINDMKPEAMGLDKASVVTREKATDAIQILDDALTYALNENTRMGAYQSRLDFTVENLVTAEENTTASLSTIRDADMAKEMMEYTKANVLAQASQSMLAQANQNSSQVMSLLQ